jgi:hypothetical protein
VGNLRSTSHGAPGKESSSVKPTLRQRFELLFSFSLDHGHGSKAAAGHARAVCHRELDQSRTNLVRSIRLLAQLDRISIRIIRAVIDDNFSRVPSAELQERNVVRELVLLLAMLVIARLEIFIVVVQVSSIIENRWALGGGRLVGLQP